MARQIGRFEVIRELGRGAQSVVYLANDPQLDREVAIKTVSVDSTDPRQGRALLEEARIVGKLRHPNVVPVFDAGEVGTEVYLVFEYVPGKTLSELLRGGKPIPAAKAAEWMRQILAGVSSAHEIGIIHRDLKPSNVIIDARDAARVMDFGIAARLSGGDAVFAGTPAYMAPEYIEHRVIDERIDVFAAGLVFFELLTGRRAATGDDSRQVMQRIVSTDIEVPASEGLDERLVSILKKALARDPAQRLPSVNHFLQALDAYLEPESTPDHGDSKQSTLDFLLRRMRHRSDFPALSESVGAINRIASSEMDSSSRLSNAILKDVALTNKILRLVNSAFYRQAGGGNISTVSRAVLVLGFDAVRNIAITVLLFEHMQKSPAASLLMDEFLRANLSALLARDLARKAGARDPEQAFICAMFHHLGRMLSQFYFPEETDEIRRLAAQKNVSEAAASAQVLGLSYEDLGTGIATTWGFPGVIVTSMRRLPPGAVRKPVSEDERLRALSSMANELCDVVAGESPEGRDAALRTVSQRFADLMRISDKGLHEAVDAGFQELTQFAGVVSLPVGHTPLGRQIKKWKQVADQADAASPDVSLGGTELVDVGVAGSGATASDAGEGSTVKTDAAAVMTAGIQDISNSLVDNFKLNDILRIILETMYRAMGFKRVLLAVKDARSGAMVGRFGFGPETTELVRGFRFPLHGAPDIFLAAIGKGVDVLISDVNDPKIRDKVPAWYRKSMPGETFVIFPLNIRNNPVALIYADKDHAGEIVIPDRELSLLRTLRNQAVLAIKQSM